MPDKKYIYTGTGPNGTAFRYEAETVSALAEAVFKRWNESDSDTKAFELSGLAQFPGGATDAEALRVLSRHVAAAKQRFDIRVEFEAKLNPWAYVPSDPRQDIIAASHLDDLTGAVVESGIRTLASGPIDRERFAAAAAQIRRGKLYHACERVSQADEWFDAVERCVVHACPNAGELTEICAARGLEAARHFAATHYRVGVLERIERDAEDDEGREHAVVGVIDLGDKKRRLGISDATDNDRSGDLDSVDQLVGKEVEIGEDRNHAFCLTEVPPFARGFSRVVRQRDADTLSKALSSAAHDV